ncbi:hypothetical protein LTS16_025836 [Friedmanniomyces endolithicus]|nr:hypothetical protein LTR57_023441 [Friedmanniomyces endolithicus]KAK1022290.1 hypothetical protein LTS16_025836 [Friedmanniomyces endolithicus]
MLSRPPSEVRALIAQLSWETITAFDFATDAIIVAIPATLLKDNTIPASNKTTVVTAFGLRIFAALAGMGATVTNTRFLLTCKTSIDLVPTHAWQETWLGSALIGASDYYLNSYQILVAAGINSKTQIRMIAGY